MADDLLEEAELTAEDILTFGPVVEAAVWNIAWLQEARAPIAVAAGKPKLGKVFDERGVGKAVLIRPCMSRGRRIRGLSPVYTPAMLAENAQVFTGWPMYLDHVPAQLAEAVAKRGRSVKELGGQVLTPAWDPAFVAEYDAEFGYQPGAVLAEVWANPVVRGLVGENPNALHTSISAWPKSGKPGAVPWAPGKKGMLIEGIRRQPQGSVDFVPRGGAGGRMLLAEGEDPNTRAWPEPKWDPEMLALAVRIAESAGDDEWNAEVSVRDRSYASATMTPSTTKPLAEMSPAELRAHLQESAPHLVGALREEATTHQPPAASGPSVTQADVEQMVKAQVAEATADIPSAEDIETQLREEFEERDRQREQQRAFAATAAELIEGAAGIPEKWKVDLKARYSLKPEGAPPALLVEARTEDDGTVLPALDVLKENVIADLDHARDLIAEATGKPRVTGEGGATRGATTERGTAKTSKASVPFWRQHFAEVGVVESAEDALTVHGVEKKVEG